MQFEAIRTSSIVDTIKNITPDAEAEEIKQKNLLTNLLRLAKEQSKGVARKVENFIQRYVKLHYITQVLIIIIRPRFNSVDLNLIIVG